MNLENRSISRKIVVSGSQRNGSQISNVWAWRCFLKVIFSARSIQIAVSLRFLLHFLHCITELALKNLVASERVTVTEMWSLAEHGTLCNEEVGSNIFFQSLLSHFPLFLFQGKHSFLNDDIKCKGHHHKEQSCAKWGILKPQKCLLWTPTWPHPSWYCSYNGENIHVLSVAAALEASEIFMCLGLPVQQLGL